MVQRKKGKERGDLSWNRRSAIQFAKSPQDGVRLIFIARRLHPLPRSTTLWVSLSCVYTVW